ncbi:hypothetical protein [uncultured Gemmiger sp.]|uniref:hypothetical protein n=1 Tax=uncultured Gemmiger sp. TaxID=1623490 RepID=UPI0025ECC4DC|nr:hypothetical protein [uncultured Gemmiger sp.]
MLDLLDLLLDLLAELFPAVRAVLLALCVLLFGLAAWAFFSTANLAGGIVSAVLGAGFLAMLICGFVRGWFKPRDCHGRPGCRGKRK